MKTDLSNRTIGVMLFVGWMTWLLAEPMADIVDDYTTPQPWFHAELTVGEDVVHYTRVIERWMRGEWTAMVQLPDDAGGWITSCDRSGAWTYRPASEGTIPMSFERFTGGCAQPDVSHRVCSEYVMEDLNGRRRVFGAFCSEIYDPSA